MINIAIDGPSGAGKSTVAKLVAKKLGITYLDTGAMYRACALFALKNGVDVHDEEKVRQLLPKIKITFRGAGEDKKVLLNGEDVSEAIREHSVSKAASDISKLPCVRDFLVERQRAIARENDVVLDGRDITSNVLPHAEYKFYLTASTDVRARRRYDELIGRGASVDYEKIKADIIDRDKNDMQRAYAPLVLTEDSTLIDSSDMTPEQVADLIIGKIKRKG